MLDMCDQCFSLCRVCVMNIYSCVKSSECVWLYNILLYSHMVMQQGSVCNTKLLGAMTPSFSPVRQCTLAAKLFWGCCFVQTQNTELVSEKLWLSCGIPVAERLKWIKRWSFQVHTQQSQFYVVCHFCLCFSHFYSSGYSPCRIGRCYEEISLPQTAFNTAKFFHSQKLVPGLQITR